MVKAFNYFSPVLLYALAWLSFTYTGLITWWPLLHAWILIPLLEVVLKPNATNLSSLETDLARDNKWFDGMLYVIVFYQYATLIFFLLSFRQTGLTTWDIAGRIGTMGLLCGTFGINVAHELGHRAKRYEQWMAKALLATSLYMHFFIEHNKGHHKYVATPQDPSSARINEPIYLFYFRTIIFSYLSAWKIANNDCIKKGRKIYSLHNEMIQAQLFQLILLSAIFFSLGGLITLYFIAAAAIGIGLLETVNYIEHYGLQRKQTINGYERAMPHHSWNSNHPIGRLMLFELSRHSDHHFLASKKYQLLNHHDDAPQLPTGYPGSMILALIPPLWFYIMNKKVREMEKVHRP